MHIALYNNLRDVVVCHPELAKDYYLISTLVEAFMQQSDYGYYSATDFNTVELAGSARLDESVMLLMKEVKLITLQKGFIPQPAPELGYVLDLLEKQAIHYKLVNTPNKLNKVIAWLGKRTSYWTSLQTYLVDTLNSRTCYSAEYFVYDFTKCLDAVAKKDGVDKFLEQLAGLKNFYK